MLAPTIFDHTNAKRAHQLIPAVADADSYLLGQTSAAMSAFAAADSYVHTLKTRPTARRESAVQDGGGALQ